MKSIILSIVSVTRGVISGSSVLSNVRTSWYASMYRCAITASVVFSSAAFLMILSSTSVKLDTYVTLYPSASNKRFNTSNTIIGRALPICA